MVGVQITRQNRQFFKRYGPKLVAELERATDVSARALRDGARAIAPVDTGALRASIHAITKRYSGFGQSWRASVRRAGFSDRRSGHTIGTPEGGAERTGSLIGGNEGMFSGGSVPRPSDAFEAFVFASVGYAAMVEYGTSRMAGRFFLTRAAIAHRPRHRRLMMDAIKKAGLRAK